MKYFFIVRLLEPFVRRVTLIQRKIIWLKFPIKYTRNYLYQAKVAPRNIYFNAPPSTQTQTQIQAEQEQDPFMSFGVGGFKNPTEGDEEQSKSHDGDKDSSAKNIKGHDPILGTRCEFKFLYEKDGKYAYKQISQHPDILKEVSGDLQTTEDNTSIALTCSEKFDFKNVYDDIFIYDGKLVEFYRPEVATLKLQKLTEEVDPHSMARKNPLEPSK